MSKSQTQPATQDTSAGSSETSSKQVRIKAKKPKIEEVEAEIIDGKIQTEDGEFYPADYSSYRLALQMCQDAGIHSMEVDPEFFKVITHGKSTPYLVTGMPAVKVFPQGTMEKGLKIERLSVRKYEELLVKKAREEAAKKKAEEDEITSLD